MRRNFHGLMNSNLPVALCKYTEHSQFRLWRLIEFFNFNVVRHAAGQAVAQTGFGGFPDVGVRMGQQSGLSSDFCGRHGNGGHGNADQMGFVMVFLKGGRNFNETHTRAFHHADVGKIEQAFPIVPSGQVAYLVAADDPGKRMGRVEVAEVFKRINRVGVAFALKFAGVYEPAWRASDGKLEHFCSVPVAGELSLLLPRLAGGHKPDFICHAMGLGRLCHLQVAHVNGVKAAPYQYHLLL